MYILIAMQKICDLRSFAGVNGLALVCFRLNIKSLKHIKKQAEACSLIIQQR